jgi:3'(2'), 5'-bisphosphate nucleotidase
MAETPDEIALKIAQICVDAAVPVMEVYASAFSVEQKADRSLVTEADRRAEAIILPALAESFPDIAVTSEEAFAAGDRPDVDGRHFLVDPVDGTREFVNRNGEFTINIGLIEAGRPIAGAVYAPAINRLFAGGTQAWRAIVEPGATVAAAKRTEIRTRALKTNALTALVSRSHLCDDTRAYLQRHDISEQVQAGSSLKFCRVAEGEADLYPRFGPTMEWDTAAGHAVLLAAGGELCCPDGSPFRYGKTSQGLRNGPFIACGGRAADFL